MSRTLPAQRGLIRPDVDADSAPWWHALGEGRLLLPHCDHCGLDWFPPTPGCPRCGATEVELRQALGRGQIYSWVVVNRALHPAFAEDAPYAIVTVDLAEGARMVGRLLAAPDDPGLGPGAPVRAVFYEVAGQALIGFEPEPETGR
jgi:uncharacterized protein